MIIAPNWTCRGRTAKGLVHVSPFLLAIAHALTTQHASLTPR